MAEMNLSSAQTSNLDNTLEDYQVNKAHTDAATGAKETEYMNEKASTYLGYYKDIPELHSAINALATWIVGKGYIPRSAEDEVDLSHLKGWGEDSFNSIIWNMLVCKKIYGDAFAEIIRDSKTNILINLKPLDPAKIKIIVDEKGMIKRYEQMDKIGKAGKIINKFQPGEILHLCNNRIADEIHGISIIKAVEWVITAKQEALEDQRKLLHRNVKPIIVFKLNTDDPDEIEAYATKMDNCTIKGENIYVPKTEVDFEVLSIPSNATLNPNPWIQYLDNTFYRIIGVPKVILGGSEEFTEASSKIGYLSFEQIYVREQTELQVDLKKQLGIEIEINKPVSLQNELLTDQSKDKENGITKPEEMTPDMQQE